MGLQRGWSRALRVFSLVGLVAISNAAPVTSQTPPSCSYSQLTNASFGDAIGISGLAVGDRLVATQSIFGPFMTFWDTYLLDTETGGAVDVPEIDTLTAPNGWDVSDDDRYLAFAHWASSSLSEIYIFEVATETLTLAVGGAESFDLSLSGDGLQMTFLSTGDLVPGQNPAGLPQAFLRQNGTGQISQLTHSMTGITEVDLSADGARLAFIEGEANQPGDLWLLDLPTDTATFIAPQAGRAFTKSISLDGTGNRVAFVSSTDLVPGGNPDGNREVFLFDATLNSILQISEHPSESSAWPSLSSDGRRLAYQGPDGNSFPFPTRAVFLGEIDDDIFVPITVNGFVGRPRISPDGQRVVFFGSGDPTDPNPPPDWELFLAECPELVGPAEEIPTLGPLGIVLLSLLLAAAAQSLLRRQRA